MRENCFQSLRMALHLPVTSHLSEMAHSYVHAFLSRSSAEARSMEHAVSDSWLLQLLKLNNCLFRKLTGLRYFVTVMKKKMD